MFTINMRVKTSTAKMFVTCCFITKMMTVDKYRLYSIYICTYVCNVCGCCSVLTVKRSLNEQHTMLLNEQHTLDVMCGVVCHVVWIDVSTIEYNKYVRYTHVRTYATCVCVAQY